MVGRLKGVLRSLLRHDPSVVEFVPGVWLPLSVGRRSHRWVNSCCGLESSGAPANRLRFEGGFEPVPLSQASGFAGGNVTWTRGFLLAVTRREHGFPAFAALPLSPFVLPPTADRTGGRSQIRDGLNRMSCEFFVPYGTNFYRGNFVPYGTKNSQGGRCAARR